MEGRSLRPAFGGGHIERDAIYWEHEGNRAIRVGKWKVVAKDPDGPWELYDIDADRTEMHDLAAEQPERVKAMREKWEAWAAAPDVWMVGRGQRQGRILRHRGAGLRHHLAVHRHLPGEHEGPRALARWHEPAFDQQQVKTDLRHSRQ
jgi:arylsulfatase